MTTVKLYLKNNEIRKFRVDSKLSSITEIKAKVNQFLTSVNLDSEKPDATSSLAYLSESDQWTTLHSDDQLTEISNFSKNSKITLKVVPTPLKEELKQENQENQEEEEEEEEEKQEENEFDVDNSHIRPEIHIMQQRRCGARFRRAGGCRRFIRFVFFLMFTIVVVKSFSSSSRETKIQHHHEFFDIPRAQVRPRFVELIKYNAEGRLNKQGRAELAQEAEFYHQSVAKFANKHTRLRQSLGEYQHELKKCQSAADESLQHQYQEMATVVQQKQSLIQQLASENNALKQQIEQLASKRDSSDSCDWNTVIDDFGVLVQRNAGEVVQNLLQSDVVESLKSKVEVLLKELDQHHETNEKRKRSFNRNSHDDDDDDDDDSSRRNKKKKSSKVGKASKFVRKIFRYL